MSHEEAIDWLLEKDQPTIRYLTLIGLLEKTRDEPVAEQQLTKRGWAAEILSRQLAYGTWRRFIPTSRAGWQSGIANTGRRLPSRSGWRKSENRAGETFRLRVPIKACHKNRVNNIWDGHGQDQRG
jgi:hypothetical protein